MTSSLTLAETQQQLLDFVTESVRALDGPALGAPVATSMPIPCDDVPDALPGQVKAQAAYWVVGSPAGLDPLVHLDRFADHWTAAGWRIFSDERPGANYVYLRSEDGYGLAMQTTPDGARLSISGSAPCADPPAPGTASG